MRGLMDRMGKLPDKQVYKPVIENAAPFLGLRGDASPRESEEQDEEQAEQEDEKPLSKV